MLLLLFLVEGVASFAYTLYFLFFPRTGRMAESFNTRFDAELGWVNVPNYYFNDMYGPGISFRTNSQGFRNSETFTTGIPPGKIRLICSGDSFTQGFGVDNASTWVNTLTRLDSRIQTVNMGQGGYGIDQAYLWYLRDGRPLDHTIHLFAFIGLDFARMQFDTSSGYGKPKLAIEQGQLVVQNVPVPPNGILAPALTRHRQTINELRTLRILNRLGRKIAGHEGNDTFWQDAQVRSRPVALKVFEHLHQINQKKGAVLVLVYLPVESDCLDNPEGEDLRRFLSEELAKQQIHFWDLTEDFRQLPCKDMKKLFIGADQMSHLMFAAGHYTVEGNRFVAEILYRRLTSTPLIAQKLAAVSAAHTR